jgi:hypothetical protein
MELGCSGESEHGGAASTETLELTANVLRLRTGGARPEKRKVS